MNMKPTLRGGLLLLLALMASLAVAQDAEPERLRIHGSNLIGQRLVPQLVEAWLHSIGYENIRRVERSVSRTEILASRDGEALVVEIDKRGTASGLKDLVAGEAEIAMTARAPNAAEIDAAWQLGDLHSPSQEWVLGLDGLVVLAGAKVQAKSVDLAGLRQIAQGKISDWSQLHQGAGSIVVHTLQDASGTGEAFSTLVLAGARIPANVQRHRDVAAVLAALRADPNSLGIVSLRAPRGGLRPLAIESGGRAFLPDAASIGAEDYPLLRRVHFHTGQLITALGRGFVQYTVSPEGQAVVARSQFVAFDLHPVPSDPIPGAPKEYQSLVADATRLPVTLRFSRGLDMFDSRSRQDLERLAVFLKRPENARRRVLLAAFANPQPGAPFQSIFQSQERVDFVSAEMLSLNMKVVSVRGFGGSLRLTESNRPDARYRNERVEVWLR
jgi:phosphate transport system substrate-binding protein